jgi:hypothetical protein
LTSTPFGAKGHFKQKSPGTEAGATKRYAPELKHGAFAMSNIPRKLVLAASLEVPREAPQVAKQRLCSQLERDVQVRVPAPVSLPKLHFLDEREPSRID